MATPLVAIPEISRTAIPVDLDDTADFPPSLSCPVVRGEVVEDDRVIIETVTDNGARALRFQFRSEVGGLFGPRNPYRELLAKLPTDSAGLSTIRIMADLFEQIHFYAPYAVYLTENGEIYARATPLSITGTTAEQDLPVRYSVGVDDARHRLVTILFGAIACRGYVERDARVVEWVRSLVPNFRSFTTRGKDLSAAERDAERVNEARADRNNCFINDCGPRAGMPVGP